MKNKEPSITIPVDLTNPGQFFACCGLLELADRLWPGAEGWFEQEHFHLSCEHSLYELLQCVASLSVSNTMTQAQLTRLNELPRLLASKPENADELEEEKSVLDGFRRKLPIVLSGQVSMRIDWFCDPYTRGFALKTWAGQQSVLTYAREMHSGLPRLLSELSDSPWLLLRDIGLPFNFDSDIGAQGGGLDIGFVFDAFKSSRIAHFNRGCRPILEFFCFVGLQRFRPLELAGGDTFRFSTWRVPLAPSIASAVASTLVRTAAGEQFEFLMFNTSKDYYCFYPAQPYQGDRDE